MPQPVQHLHEVAEPYCRYCVLKYPLSGMDVTQHVLQVSEKSVLRPCRRFGVPSTRVPGAVQFGARISFSHGLSGDFWDEAAKCAEKAFPTLPKVPKRSHHAKKPAKPKAKVKAKARKVKR
jgi:hypothetical protein